MKRWILSTILMMGMSVTLPAAPGDGGEGSLLDPVGPSASVAEPAVAGSGDGSTTEGVPAWRPKNYAGRELDGKNFTNKNLRKAKFRNAKLTGAKFVHADITGADFTGADLTNADFSQVKGAGSIFNGAKLNGASLTQGDFTGGKFSGAKLLKATCIQTRFEKADLTRADFTGADLTQAKLEGSKRSGIKLKDAKLIQTILDPRTKKTSECQGTAEEDSILEREALPDESAEQSEEGLLDEPPAEGSEETPAEN